MLIGVNGRARNGKDTIGNYLVEKYGFKRYALADKMKEYALRINPLVRVSVLADVQDIAIDSVEKGWLVYLSDLVGKVGWEEAKGYTDVRVLLQNIGTEGRKLFGEDFWVNQLHEQMKKELTMYTSGLSDVPHFQGNAVITDIRFDNEAEWIRKHHGYVVNVHRHTELGVPQHVSEDGINTGLVDVFLENNGTLEELYEKIDNAMVVLKSTQQDS